MTTLVWLLVTSLALTVQCQLFYPNTKLKLPNKVTYKGQDDTDPGTPLFLTPYIQKGKLEEARKLARVPFTEELNVTSYAGFLTVDETYQSNLYFWYFPPIESKSDTAPVVVWLQGGPGSSSLFGQFVENGPIMVENRTFKYRKTNWALYNHMIYIDNPVGAGYSFTNDETGYCTNETQVGENLHSAVTQFLQLFPNLQKNPFFITGESYAEKYVPAFGYTIHKKNPSAKVKINLAGMAIGNGWTDPVNQLVYGDYLYQIGVLDAKDTEKVRESDKKTVDFILEKEWLKAFNSNIAIEIFKNRSSLIRYYNYVYPSELDKSYTININTSAIRNDMHVGSLDYDFINDAVHKKLREDTMQSVVHWLSELLNFYTVYVYTGQLDVIVPYPGVVNYLKKLTFMGSDEYANATRRIWKVGNDVAGYTKIGGNLVEVLVRNSGHLVPADQSEWALDLITKLTTPGSPADVWNSAN